MKGFGSKVKLQILNDVYFLFLSDKNNPLMQ